MARGPRSRASGAPPTGFRPVGEQADFFPQKTRSVDEPGQPAVPAPAGDSPQVIHGDIHKQDLRQKTRSPSVPESRDTSERRAAAEVAAETAAFARVERNAEARSRALAESCRRVFADPRVEAVSRVPGVLRVDEIEWAITFAPRGEIRRRTFYGPSIDAAYAKAVEADRVVVNEQKRRR